MPTNLAGRDKVLKYLDANNIQIADLATMYGVQKQDMQNYLKGHLIDTPMANKLVIRIISDFKIR